MLKNKSRIIVFILMFLVVFIYSTKVNAVTVSQLEYSEEYKEWLELPEEERNKLVTPKMFDININVNQNKVFTKIKTLMNSVTNPRFDLREKISNNLKIRNQENTNACWAFATISSLETNLALKDNTKVYDYSESHMDYSSSQSFYDGKIQNGFSRKVLVGGNFQIGEAYLTNGSGAVLEEDMPFINTKEDISIKDIQGKNVVTKVTDTEEFYFSKYVTNEKIDSEELNALIIKMKEHIKENGSISAGIHGADLLGDCYNNLTGAIYCKDENKCKMNHNVSIIGWDDNYSIDNFNKPNKPTKKGAWIIRNSWGEKAKVGMAEDYILLTKMEIFNEFPDGLGGYKYNSALEVPDELAILVMNEAGHVIEGEYVYMLIGDNGFMYVSYEDVNIYNQLFGIEKATNNVDYDKIYQYNELGYNNVISLSQKKVYIANVFERDKTNSEVLTEVSLNVMQNVKCKVYVNSKNGSKAIQDLQEVELIEGKTETFDAGYHTLEFKNPIALTGDEFVVVIEVEALDDDVVYCSMISKTNNNFWDNIIIKKEANYITFGEYFNKNMWIDTVIDSSSMKVEPGNLTIKAFTKEVENIPTQAPTVRPTTTAEPTQAPTVRPTATAEPTQTPTVRPTATAEPTQAPTVKPTVTIEPTQAPTVRPTATAKPTQAPTVKPTATAKPTQTPIAKPIATTKPTPIISNNKEILGAINTNSTYTENTTSNQTKLPHAGKTEIIIGLIVILSINIVVVYKKYKKIY